MLRHTKIAATIGPACGDAESIRSLVKAGLNIARLNFSHGTHESHASMINLLRTVEKNEEEPLTIMQDLRGPRLRLGELPEKGLPVKPGQVVVFCTTLDKYDGTRVPLPFAKLENSLKAGEHILINDGRIEGVIKRIEGSSIFLEIIEGGLLSSNKGLNFPNSQLNIPVLSDKDKEDLKFGLLRGVDVVAMSFVSSAKDILDARFLMREYAKELNLDMPFLPALVAKIERHEAVENLKEIIAVCDGIMVARGDLGLEVPKEEVPLIQKRIIDAAAAAAKPVMVATQLLDSMQENVRPTRAEVSDVANAVIDGADSLLLTNETAAGKHPVLVVKTMSEIILATEKSHYDDVPLSLSREHTESVESAITGLSRLLAEKVKAQIILAASLTGQTGRLISHLRPELPILVATGNVAVWRQLNLSWGVRPFILPECRTIEELIERSMVYIKKFNLAKIGAKMIIVAGEPVGQAGNVNLVEVREIV